jgi:predicted nucleic acid-binding protein
MLKQRTNNNKIANWSLNSVQSEHENKILYHKHTAYLAQNELGKSIKNMLITFFQVIETNKMYIKTTFVWLVSHTNAFKVYNTIS